jgi:hypothetical protein
MQTVLSPTSKRWLTEPSGLRACYLAAFEHRPILVARSQKCVEAFVEGLPILESQIQVSDFCTAIESLQSLLLTSGLNNAWRVVFDSLHAGMEFCMKLESFADSVALGEDTKRCLRLAHELKAWGRQTRLPVE